MDLYSLLLAAGIGAAVLALALALAVRLGFYRALLVQWVPAVAGLSVLCVGVAAVYHLMTGHGPESEVPLEPFAFLAEHRAVVVIPALALLAVGLGRVPKSSRSLRRR
jgi:hypothetical protein